MIRPLVKPTYAGVHITAQAARMQLAARLNVLLGMIMRRMGWSFGKDKTWVIIRISIFVRPWTTRLPAGGGW